MQNKTFTFNRPIITLLLLPLAVLGFVLLVTFYLEGGVGKLIFAILNIMVFLGLSYLTVVRRMTIGEEGVMWKTLGKPVFLSWKEIQRFGQIQNRRSRFVFVSASSTLPFNEKGIGMVPGGGFYLVQYSKDAWNRILSRMQVVHPEIRPEEIEIL